MTSWKACGKPAGLWYVAMKGRLFEAWAQSPYADHHGPTVNTINDWQQFHIVLIGTTRSHNESA